MSAVAGAAALLSSLLTRSGAGGVEAAGAGAGGRAGECNRASHADECWTVCEWWVNATQER